jgi:tRNA nucleotidyltransferase (CCA-adding enzyme)
MSAMQTPVTADLATRVRALPGMETLIPALEGLGPVFLVGGAVRDLLRGVGSVDVDLAVEGRAPAVAHELAARLGGTAVAHDRFGTATVRGPGVEVDLASTRRETYARPGALPAVEPAPLAEDLRRRDFTVNAMALPLAAEGPGGLIDPHGGEADLRAGLLRVLHDQSFVDDPTRLLRGLRYAARLELGLESSTAALAREAAAEGALETVSGTRVRDELMRLLAEGQAPTAVGLMAETGVAGALHPALRADPDLIASVLVACAQTGAEPALAALAALCSGDPEATKDLVERLELNSLDREAVVRSAHRAAALVNELRQPLTPSRLYALLHPEPPEALALALALGGPADPVLTFVSSLRDAHLEISGADLLGAGLQQSEAIGHALQETLRRKLDGELSGREQELRAAIEAAREAS